MKVAAGEKHEKYLSLLCEPKAATISAAASRTVVSAFFN